MEVPHQQSSFWQIIDLKSHSFSSVPFTFKALFYPQNVRKRGMCINTASTYG